MDVRSLAVQAGLAPVSLVLTVRNSASDLPDLLDSIKRQQLLPSEVLIVDLGSTDAHAGGVALVAAAGGHGC